VNVFETIESVYCSTKRQQQPPTAMLFSGIIRGNARRTPSRCKDKLDRCKMRSRCAMMRRARGYELALKRQLREKKSIGSNGADRQQLTVIVASSATASSYTSRHTTNKPMTCHIKADSKVQTHLHLARPSTTKNASSHQRRLAASSKKCPQGSGEHLET